MLGVTVLGRRMLGPRGGLAGLILATAPIAVAESKLATTDATLALFLFGCQFCLWELGKRPSRGLAGLFWLCLSLSILVKGPVGPALIASASSARVVLRLANCGVEAVALAERTDRTGGPDSSLVRRDQHRLGRRVSSVRRGPADPSSRLDTTWKLTAVFPAITRSSRLWSFFPWSAFIPAALVGAWVRRKADPKFGFLIGWAIGPLAPARVFPDEADSLLLACVPSLCIAAVVAHGSIIADEVNIRRRPLGRLGVALAGRDRPGRHRAALGGCRDRAGNLAPPMLVVGVLIAVGALGGMFWLQQGATERAVYFLAGTWAIVMLCCWRLVGPAHRAISDVAAHRREAGGSLERRSESSRSCSSTRSPA